MGFNFFKNESDMKIEQHVFMLDGENVFSWRLLQKHPSLPRRSEGREGILMTAKGNDKISGKFFGFLNFFLLMCGAAESLN